MNNRIFKVAAHWDDEAGVFVSDSDIKGLHIEAATIDEFESIVFDAALELIIANHMTAADLAGKPVRDLVPGILWQRPPAAA